MPETLYAYCMRTGNPALLYQWDSERNNANTPKTISYGSKKKVWWQCSEGHVWQASICSRTSSGAGCPYCAGKFPLIGENDFATRFPYLAAQWHPTKNFPLTPEQVLPGSHRVVWWLCEHGHTWQAQIKSRVAGCGCPICANRELLSGSNDLASQFPELARQWHPIRNGRLLPNQIVARTHQKVWWICEKGHVWQASVVSRTSNGSGCPVCAGKRVVPGENDLASQFPNIALQWHPEKNGTLTPDQVTSYSNRHIWWCCPMGHEYQAAVSSRTQRNSGCPYCAGRKVLPGFNDLASVEPEIALQWHPALNGSLTPEMVTAGSHRKVWWQCSEGHVWKAVICSRTGSQKCGCPVCAGRISSKKQSRYQNMLMEEKGAVPI